MPPAAGEQRGASAGAAPVTPACPVCIVWQGPASVPDQSKRPMELVSCAVPVPWAPLPWLHLPPLPASHLWWAPLQIKDSAPGAAAALKKLYEEHLLPYEQQQARRSLAARLAKVQPAAGEGGESGDHMAAQVLEAMLASGPVGYDDLDEADPPIEDDEPARKRQKTKQEVRLCVASLGLWRSRPLEDVFRKFKRSLACSGSR